MDLALAIIFLWLGAACLFVAFHPINTESTGVWGPQVLIKALQADLSKTNPSNG